MVLETAKQQLELLLCGAGLTVVFSCSAVDTLRPLIVIVTPDNRAASLKVHDPEALGVTLRSERTMGTVYLFFGRVNRSARAHRIDTAIVLGYALAHEIGHALLPTGSHTAWGIMRGAWDDQQFRLIAGGTLGFSGAEAAAIRQRLERR